MKRNNRVVLFVGLGVAGVFLVAVLAVGGLSWYRQLQAENKYRAEAEAAQRAAADAAAARLSAVQLNIEQASRSGQPGKVGPGSIAEAGKPQELSKP